MNKIEKLMWVHKRYGLKLGDEIIEDARKFLSSYTGNQPTTDLRRYFQLTLDKRVSIYGVNVLREILKEIEV